jgi:hypothetical protein
MLQDKWLARQERSFKRKQLLLRIRNLFALITR